MKVDLLLKGGHVIDRDQEINEMADVAVKDGRIWDVSSKLSVEAKETIDAESCIVSPGLIDNHLHMYADATDAGIDANIGLLPNGVTTGVEGGSPGVANYEQYRKTVINQSRVRIKCYISAASTGMITRKYPENFNPDYFERERICALFKKYPDELKGLKIRFSKPIIGELGMRPLEEVVKLADEIGCHVTVHITNPAADVGEIARRLRPGDILCHIYQGKGDTILDENDRVKPLVREARNRGVFMDACNGAFNFSIDVAKKAIADGFYPDIISTDYNTMTMYHHPVISLPYLMSKYLAFGMKVEDVFAACTSTPARAIGMSGEIGTLHPGAPADIAVFRLEERNVLFYDCHENTMEGRQILVPQMTVKDGCIMFRQVTFNKEL